MEGGEELVGVREGIFEPTRCRRELMCGIMVRPNGFFWCWVLPGKRQEGKNLYLHLYLHDELLCFAVVR